MSVRPIGHQLSGFIAAFAAMTSVASAHEPAAENRLVDVFQSHCIATVADPKPFKAELAPSAIATLNDGTHWIEWTLSLPISLDPHWRLEVRFTEGPAPHRRDCSVGLAFADRSLIVAALKDKLGLGEGTPSIEGSGISESEVRRWTVRVSDTDAVIEFRAPTYTGAPGRTLILFVGGRPATRPMIRRKG